MFQLDLFSPEDHARPIRPELPERPLYLPAILERLTVVCERPRYSFMVLNLIAQASAETGSAGPYILKGSQRIPVRDWLCGALMPVAQRDPRRRAIENKVRRELEAERALPIDPDAAKRIVNAQVRKRVRQSGRTNVSRAVSELVRAGFVRRHYQGYLQPLAIGWAPARKQITFLLGLADTEHARLLTFPDNVLAIFCGCSQSVRRAHAWRH